MKFEEVKKHIGYKKCRDNIMLKLEILGKNNEKRENAVVPEFAKMRSSKVKVLKIYKLHFNQKGKRVETVMNHVTAQSKHDIKFKYKFNEIIEVDTYDENIENVCSQGIHYFMSEEAAYYYDFTPQNGICKRWYDNGVLMYQFNCRYGKRNGIKKEWFDTGILKSQENYLRDILHGKTKTWYHDGKLQCVINYKWGIPNGKIETYHSNGNLEKICFYENDKLCGKYMEYYSIGKLKSICFYENGMLNGFKKLYFRNGQIKYKCFYDTSVPSGKCWLWDKDGNLIKVIDRGSSVH